MKLTTIVILFGCLAFTSAYRRRSFDSVAFHMGVVETMSESVENFIQSAKSPFQSAYNTVKDLLTKSYIKINESVQKSMGSLQSITRNIEKQFDELKSKNQRSKDCVEKYYPELNNTKDQIQLNLQSCAQTFIKHLQNQENVIREDMNLIDKKVEDFRLAVVTCIHFNPITTTKCVFNRINEYRLIIEDVYNGFKKTAADCTVNAANIPKDLVSCNRDAIENGVIEINNVLKKTQHCEKSEN